MRTIAYKNTRPLLLNFIEMKQTRLFMQRDCCKNHEEKYFCFCVDLFIALLIFLRLKAFGHLYQDREELRICFKRNPLAGILV